MRGEGGCPPQDTTVLVGENYGPGECWRLIADRICGPIRMLNLTAAARISGDREMASTWPVNRPPQSVRWGEEETMYDNILVGYDGSASSGDALVLAEMLAQPTKANVVIAYVFERHLYAIPPAGYARWEEFLHEDGEKIVRRGLRDAKKHDSIPADHLQTKIVGASSPARGLHELAEELGADLTIVGASNRSRIGQALIGSTAQRLLHGSHSPVCVAPAGFGKSKRTASHLIAVGYDGSSEAKLALDSAWHIAAESGGGVRVLSVAIPPPLIHGKGAGSGQGYQELKAGIEEMVQEELDEAVSRQPANVETEGVLLRGDPAIELCRAAADADLLFMGSRGYGPFGRVLTGSVSGAVIEASVCPVVISPRAVEADADAEPALIASGHES